MRSAGSPPTPPTLFGVVDRGVLAPGAFADVNVIDLDALAVELPEVVHDFPTGAGRDTCSGRGAIAPRS